MVQNTSLCRRREIYPWAVPQKGTDISIITYYINVIMSCALIGLGNPTCPGCGTWKCIPMK